MQAAGEGALGLARPAGRLRDDERRQRRDPRAGLLPDLRPDGLHRTDDPEPGRTNSIRDPVLAPLTNRATESYYPTGSTFKIITALAALEGGEITPVDVDRRRRQDHGRRPDLPERGRRRLRAGRPGPGPAGLLRRLLLRARPGDVGHRPAAGLGGASWGSAGSPGSTCPGRPKGCCRARSGATSSSPKALTERPWSAGDNIQLATGQGDLQTNPLQMAIAYAALGNGGTIVTPHVGMEVEDAAGRVLKEFDPKPRRQDPDRPRLPDGDPRRPAPGGAGRRGGTSYGVFGGFPIQVAGKTGTAERPAHADQSWYAVLAPYPDPRIVTIVTDRGRRLRRRIRGPGRAADPRSLFRQARDRSRRPRTAAAPNDVRDPQPGKPAPSRSPSASASASASASPTWTGR